MLSTVVNEFTSSIVDTENFVDLNNNSNNCTDMMESLEHSVASSHVEPLDPKEYGYLIDMMICKQEKDIIGLTNDFVELSENQIIAEEESQMLESALNLMEKHGITLNTIIDLFNEHLRASSGLVPIQETVVVNQCYETSVASDIVPIKETVIINQTKKASVAQPVIKNETSESFADMKNETSEPDADKENETSDISLAQPVIIKKSSAKKNKKVKKIKKEVKKTKKDVKKTKKDVKKIKTEEDPTAEKKKRGPYKKRVREPKVFACHLCSITCKSPSSLTTHVDAVHLNKKLNECNYCIRVFSRKSHLMEHIANHIMKKGKLKCRTCHQKFEKAAALTMHEKSHKPTFACKLCHEEVKSKSKLKEHLATHKVDTEFACSVCDMKFALIDRLQTHLKVHVQKSFDCAFCSQKLKSMQTFKVHLISMHRDRDDDTLAEQLLKMDDLEFDFNSLEYVSKS